MNKDQVLSGLYNYLLEQLPPSAISLIIANDIRVENFFAIHTGVYLDRLVNLGHINNYSFQHTILLGTARVHIDIIFTDAQGIVSCLELKHFSISQNRGQGRKLNFYTGNSKESKKVGIIGDCIKLDYLKENGFIEHNVNLICCAFITQRPTQLEIELMSERIHNYPEINGWNLQFPVALDLQSQSMGMLTLEKNAEL
jgi:hypothetical protein